MRMETFWWNVILKSEFLSTILFRLRTNNDAGRWYGHSDHTNGLIAHKVFLQRICNRYSTEFVLLAPVPFSVYQQAKSFFKAHLAIGGWICSLDCKDIDRGSKLHGFQLVNHCLLHHGDALTCYKFSIF